MKALMLRDGPDRFGAVSVFLHWYIAATILFLLPSGLIIDYLGPHGPLKPLREDLTWWHMSFAVTAIPVFLFRVFWRVSSGKPVTHRQHWSLHLAAETVWRALLLLTVYQSFTGPLLELSHDEPVHWFGNVLISPPLPAWMSGLVPYLHDAHVYGAYAIGMLLSLHVIGALKHVVVDRDQVLRTMVIPGERQAVSRAAAPAE
jgi:cytochrome b561